MLPGWLPFELRKVPPVFKRGGVIGPSGASSWKMSGKIGFGIEASGDYSRTAAGQLADLIEGRWKLMLTEVLSPK